MPANPWIETEKDCELVNGEWVEKRKRLSRPIGIHTRTKEIWEIIFKFFAAIAIFSPFLIISLQNENSRTRDRKASLSLVYSGILTDLRVYQSYYNTNDTTDYRGVTNRLGAEYPAKLALYGSDRITTLYDTIVRCMAIWQLTSDVQKELRRTSDFFDGLYNLCEYMHGDSVAIITYRHYQQDTTTVINTLLDLFTSIQTARDVCVEINSRLSQEDGRAFGVQQRQFRTAMDQLSHLDWRNQVVFDAFSNEVHRPYDEIVAWYKKDGDMVKDLVRETMEAILFFNKYINRQKERLQVEFREELR